MHQQNQQQQDQTKAPACPVCQSTDLSKVLDIPQIPVLANVLWEQRADALSAPRGDVSLVFCNHCGHVYNQAFDPSILRYDLQYENSLHFSPRFQAYADRLAHYLINQYDLYGKEIIEIGSGKGDFLRMLCEYGGNTGTGFDPSYEPSEDEQYPGMTFVRDVYAEGYADRQADLILSRHVLEHLERPAAFVQSLRRTIGDRRNTVVYTEVPNLVYILRDTAVWDIIYEHYSYFSPQSLAGLFTWNGFNVLHQTDGFGGQFLSIETKPRQMDRPAPEILYDQPLAALANQVNGFAERCQEKMACWQSQIAQLHSEGKRVVLWGAGSKGISFLNMLHIQDEVEYIVDINPRKHGKFVTGAGQQIVPVDFLTGYQPDTIIIMNPIYSQEIQNIVQPLGLQVEFLSAS